MPKKLLFFLSGVSFFFLFIFFSFLVHKDIFKQFDFNMTVRLQDNLPRRVDNEFSFLSEVGSFEVSLVVLSALIGVLVFRRKILAATSAFVLFGGFHLIELFGKFFVDHLPPPHFMLRTKQLIDFPQFHVRSEFSYPSGHSGRALFLSVIILFLIWQSSLPKAAKMALTGAVLFYDVSMLISRVYLGEHWSTDVIGGGILGLGLGLITGTFLVGKGKSIKLFPRYKIKLVKETE